MNTLLTKIVSVPEIHAKWLNTLSFMENAGARKISACEHRTNVDLIQLKHAAEEHRHAYYLKKQILKISKEFCPNYQPEYLLAPKATQYYLHALDIQACKYLKSEFELNRNELKFLAYLMVTYAIEVRADELYPEYQNVLTKNNQKVMVKSIIAEEQGHLEEMIVQLENFSNQWKQHADKIIALENILYQNWIEAIKQELAHV